MFMHYLDAHRAMLAMKQEHGGDYIVVRVAMNHFEVQDDSMGDPDEYDGE